MELVAGGNDVFVDIGNKYYGVRACQKYLGGIEGSQTLHVGDQFLSAGANDFKARSALALLCWFFSGLYPASHAAAGINRTLRMLSLEIMSIRHSSS